MFLLNFYSQNTCNRKMKLLIPLKAESAKDFLKPINTSWVLGFWIPLEFRATKRSEI